MASGNSKTLVLMDGTYSMADLLHKAKVTVGSMFSRAKEICNSDFIIQFALYRNYSNSIEDILVASPSETTPEKLRKFMETVGVDGGLGFEAVEIGLWYAN